MSEDRIKGFRDWYSSLPNYRHTNGPALGIICAALLIVRKLQSIFNLDYEAYLTKGGGQVSQLSKHGVTKILKSHGVDQPILSEVGRTNRGSLGAIKSLLRFFTQSGADQLPVNERVALLEKIEAFLVGKIRVVLDQQGIEFEHDPTKTTEHSISALLKKAKARGRDGIVAQHLVGAKLQVRFPQLKIENYSSSTADQQLGRQGDFLVGNTAFHVTVAPSDGHVEKCHKNLRKGFRVYFLVPALKLLLAKDLTGEREPTRIAVQSIESFVSQNIDELSEFSTNKLTNGLRKLLETYNERVSAVETDRSLLIEIPENLLPPDEDQEETSAV